MQTRRQLIQWVATAGSLCLSPWAGSQTAPSRALLDSRRLRYTVSGKKSGIQYSANATLDWRRNATRYEATWSASLLFVFKRKQTSSGSIANEKITPQRFVDEGKRIREASLDQKAQQVRYTEAGPAAWVPGMQDRVSLFFTLPSLITAAQREGRTRIDMPVTGANGRADWEMDIGKPETVTTPAGTWLATPVKRRVAAADTAATLWYAGDHNLIPVRILMTEPDGTFLDQRLDGQMPLPNLP